jgi:acyl-CoA synthetase (AMP-forming)/AMP-acid ligase II
MIRMAVQTFCGGGALVCMDRIDAAGVADWVQRERIEVLLSVPTMLHDLLLDPGIDPGKLGSLVRTLTGAAGLPDQLRQVYRDRFGTDVQFSYGLTEAPTAVAQTDPSEPFVAGSCGRALPHLQISILAADGSQLPPSAAGEVAIGPRTDGRWAGVYMPILGYWRNPAATASVLRDGWLLTGDIGTLDAEGRLFIHDRRSDLILRGGANVYPAEVERVIEQHHAVRATAVVGEADARLGQVVAAVIELAPDAEAAVVVLEALERACEQSLARYKRPVRWYVVPEMPRNAMNKIVKPRLLEMIASGALPYALNTEAGAEAPTPAVCH